MKNLTIIQVKNRHSGSVILSACRVANTFTSRLVGYMGTGNIEQGHALLFPDCNNVHVWFMKIPIDIAFLKKTENGEYLVRKVMDNVKPWRILPLVDLKSNTVIESKAGTFKQHSLKEGDILCLS